MKRNTFLVLLLLFFSSIFGKEHNTHQLSDTINLGDVVVTDSMSKVNLKSVPISISVVDKERISRSLETSLLPLLSEEVPGLFITQRGIMGYGVANGAAGAMNIRGVGGAPTAGVLVLIDGHPQYMGLMGHPLADSYQSLIAERVEVVRGPASLLYGSNAMGGVINIITQKIQKNGLYNSAQVMYGSFNTLSSDISSSWRKNKFFANVNIGYNRTDGHRENMDYEQVNSYTKFGYDFSKNWSGFADLNVSNSFSSNPGMVSSPIIDNDAEVLRAVTSFVIENSYKQSSGAVKLYHNFGKHFINDGYSVGGQALLHRFNSTDFMAGFSAYQSYNLFEGNNSTLGFDYQQFGGKAWNGFIDGSADVDLADVQLNDYAFYLNTQQAILKNKLMLNAGIRLNNHEINGREWIPQLGLSYTPKTSTFLKAIVSKGFRNPTIREMYMFPPQNPDLLAESLMNCEVSWIQHLLNKQLKLGLSLFHIVGENMIQVVMNNGRPLNLNAGKLENSGFELDASMQLNQKLSVSTNYSFLHMKYKLMG